MSGKSENTALLSVALQVFKEELLASIPPSKKYQALMVANAMTISVREAERGPMDNPSPELLEAMAEILGLPADAPELNSQLVKRLRKGVYSPDHPKTKGLHRALLQDAHRRVAISNPRYLSR